jgi:hypothetical protein
MPLIWCCGPLEGASAEKLCCGVDFIRPNVEVFQRPAGPKLLLADERGSKTQERKDGPHGCSPPVNYELIIGIKMPLYLQMCHPIRHPWLLGR